MIKSPFSKVGIIDPEGILNGSKIKDLSKKISKRIGTKASDNSIRLDFFLRKKRPTTHIRDKNRMIKNKIV